MDVASGGEDREPEAETTVDTLRMRLVLSSMRVKVAVVLGIWLSFMFFALLANAPELIGFLGSVGPQNVSEELGSVGPQNVSEELEVGVSLSARIVSNVSDPFSPIVVELVCTNILQTENLTLSPFPEFGFNPVFLLQDPSGHAFLSWSRRFGPPPLQSSVSPPGENLSQVFDLCNVAWYQCWLDWPEGGHWYRGPNIFNLSGEYRLTVIYRPFYHELWTNETRAGITLNASLAFKRPRKLEILHLGTSNLSFLSRDLGSVMVEAGSGPYPAIETAIVPYNLVIFDNVPPEWIGEHSQAVRRAVLDVGLDILFFGGPLSLGGDGSSSSWEGNPLGDLLPAEPAGPYGEFGPGNLDQPFGETRFSDFDGYRLETVRHRNPCEIRLGANLLLTITGTGRAPDVFLCQWQVGKGTVTVCTAGCAEILGSQRGKDLLTRIVEVAYFE